MLAAFGMIEEFLPLTDGLDPAADGGPANGTAAARGPTGAGPILTAGADRLTGGRSWIFASVRKAGAGAAATGDATS